LTSGSIDLRDFENPSAPEESGEASNRIYVYAPYTVEDPLTGARQVTAYRNTYDFVQGVWSAGGKRIEASIVELDATDETTAMLTAQQYFKERGISLRSFEFEHISGPLNVGDVIPFIWNELGIAEALVVRRQVGYLIGQEVFYRVQLGGDMSFQRSTMYLVERRLKEITGDAAYFSPPPSPYPGYPTEGGIVTPASPSGDAGAEKVDISWEYPQSVITSASFGGFIVLRSGDAGTSWAKASTGEPILTAQNPLAPDTAVPSFTDTNVVASTGYIYKVAAVDVSGATPVLTEYSAESATLTPTAPSGVDFADAYQGLGLNIPKIVDSVDHWNGYAKNIASLTSGASTTATVTITAGHNMTTGSGEVYVVHIKGVTGGNSGDVPDGYYAATYASSTTFTITKTGTNSLSLSGGIATIYRVGGGFLVDAVAYTLTGTPGSVATQYPIGQLVYAESDGKLYRNGKIGTNLFDYYWTRAAVDAIDVSADGQISISADRLTAGAIDAGIINVTNLNASNITSGTINASVIGVTNLNASNITTGTLSATRISGGTFDASTMTVQNLSASSITTGTLSANRISGGTLSGITLDINSRLQVDSSGNLTSAGAYFNPADGGPAITLAASAAEGDIAVPSGNALSVGFVTGNSFTEAWRMTSGGVIDAMSGLSVTGSLTLPASSITNTMLAADAVTSAKIAAGAVGNTELATDAVTAAKISAGAVGQTELSDTAIYKLTTPTALTGAARFAVWSSATGVAALRRSDTSSASERAFKKDIEPVSVDTDSYALLNWVKFKYDDVGMRNYGIVDAGVEYDVSDDNQWGLIADEVEQIFPEAIQIESNNGVTYRGIRYEALRAIEGLVISNLLSRVKSLEARIAELEA